MTKEHFYNYWYENKFLLGAIVVCSIGIVHDITTNNVSADTMLLLFLQAVCYLRIR